MQERLFSDYGTVGFDEVFSAPGQPSPEYRALLENLSDVDPRQLRRCDRVAELIMRDQGITFTVYGRRQGVEQIIPFDPMPRLVSEQQWRRLERGLVQRIIALNLFLKDIYHTRHILRDGVISPDVVLGSSGYRRECVGLNVPKDIYIHVAGIDLIRDRDGRYLVLEDNGRTPSGVSYVLKNREISKQALPFLFAGYNVKPVEDYPAHLLEVLRHIAPADVDDPKIVLLTPGVYNSAFYEHSFLARRMGIPLVEGRDLFLDDGQVYMRTIRGAQRVDVIYRRVDDEFLDPLYFRRDSVLGVAGMMAAYRTGRIGLANAVGTGVADDKGIYPFVPDMIRYYLREDPILENVETFRPELPSHMDHILGNLEKLVVKAVDASGGYGMLIGPASTAEQRDEFARRVRSNPRGYIAQPTISLSQHPTLVEDRFEPRHIDLRPFVLYGENVKVLAGGLTRVALVKGSLVVNSSQGGGTKDTWVLGDDWNAPAIGSEGIGGVRP
ncbi:circularly permuted type 2 ATP-grasp protein [bacterium]|nr:circularly permuted type 2 ATP-grasp protein [bacterium]